MEDKMGIRKKARELTAVANVHLVDTVGGAALDRGHVGDTKGNLRVTEKQKPAMRLVKPAPPAPQPPVADHVSRRLKALYDDVLNQPIPDRFMDLLKELDSEGKK